MSEKNHPKPNAGLAGKRFVDLFAGIGGFHLAMDSMGMQCVFASEWDRHAAQVYEANFNLKPRGDITKVSVEEVPDHDVLCGGFPCQAFSISGKRLGFADTRGTLFFELARIVKERQPEALLLENVKNFAQHDSGKTLKTVLATLDEIGYVAYHKVINAAELGFPTARRRIYIVAFRKDLKVQTKGTFSFPRDAIPEERQPLRLFLESKAKALAQVKPLEGVDLIAKKTNPRNLASRLARRPVSPARLGIVGGGGQGERIYSIDGPAITFSAYGGGIASKTGAYWVGGLARKLTPRECANVMGFPAKFKIAVRPQQAYKQFGNSVVVGVLRLIAGQMDAALRRAAGEKIEDPERPEFPVPHKNATSTVVGAAGKKRKSTPHALAVKGKSPAQKAKEAIDKNGATEGHPGANTFEVDVASAAKNQEKDKSQKDAKAKSAGKPTDTEEIVVSGLENTLPPCLSVLGESSMLAQASPPTKRGRPKTRDVVDPQAPKRSRGRPKREEVLKTEPQEKEHKEEETMACVLSNTEDAASVLALKPPVLIHVAEVPLLGSTQAIETAKTRSRSAATKAQSIARTLPKGKPAP